MLIDLARSLSQSVIMFWQTLWPLLLGFFVSGAIQAFLGREQVERRLGNHGPGAIVRASVFGMVSSSCSYAASATAKTLVRKGADFVSATVFMFAATNLVLELAVVIVVLLGWRFVVAEFAGGVLMIVLLVLLGPMVLTQAVTAPARLRSEGADAHGAFLGSVTTEGGPGSRASVRSLRGWSAAASYTVSDLKMLRRELVIGFLLAGVVATVVPSAAWNAVFVRGHGFLTEVENAAVAPVIAFVSSVCSVGNVPLAAALWRGGASLGGVVSFLFADLLAFPLVLVYRRYYGWALTIRLVGLFWLVMASAGLLVGVALESSGEPAPSGAKPLSSAFGWNATTILDLVAVVLFSGLYVLYRRRAHFGLDSEYALDPVCGMQVRRSTAPASAEHLGTRFFFCSDHCAHRFREAPDRFAPRRLTESSGAGGG